LAKKPVNEAGDGRTRLISTALRLFAEKGFDGVTVRDIATASDVSVGLINHHFGSKEGLRTAVDDQFIRQFEEALSWEPRAQEPGRVTPEDYAATVDEWISRHQDTWPDTANYFRRALLEESDWGYAIFARFYAIVQQAVTKMDADGVLGPQVDRLWLPFLMMYLELGTLLLDPYIKRTIGKSGFETDLWRRRHRAYTDLIRRGVVKRSAEPKG
jgi:AcrR family transcriptional regulator